jgi:hypothetical protein
VWLLLRERINDVTLEVTSIAIVPPLDVYRAEEPHKPCF